MIYHPPYSRTPQYVITRRHIHKAVEYSMTVCGTMSTLSQWRRWCQQRPSPIGRCDCLQPSAAAMAARVVISVGLVSILRVPTLLAVSTHQSEHISYARKRRGVATHSFTAGPWSLSGYFCGDFERACTSRRRKVLSSVAKGMEGAVLNYVWPRSSERRGSSAR